MEIRVAAAVIAAVPGGVSGSTGVGPRATELVAVAALASTDLRLVQGGIGGYD
jgi:hypothetical protein